MILVLSNLQQSEEGNCMEKYILNINGKDVEVSVDGRKTLMYVLREELDLTGTKCGCATGDCGACKVIIDKKAVNSCLVQVKNAVNKEIITIEGVAQGVDFLHPIQQAFIDAGAIQCGFCTPGMVISAKALLDENNNPTKEDIRKAFSNNLCRCTGYVKIIEAVQLAAKRMRGEA